jgi:hypothetical protein
MAIPTAGASKPVDRNGGLYQRRAFGALPLLVRQALAGQQIYYSDIANELDMENPRNMNYVLGSVGTSLRALSVTWDHEVPPLQALVISKSNQLPGEGFSEFVPDPVSFRKAPLRIRRQIVDGLLAKVYAYTGWQAVLDHFGQALPAPVKLSEMLPAHLAYELGAAGESDAHRDFKMFVATHPQVIGLPRRTPPGGIEYVFPSGDTVDVLFIARGEYIAVEVKSRISVASDILRGIFQCVKYQSLLDAVVAVERRRVDTRTLLVLEGELPKNFRSIANILGVSVLEHVGSEPHAIKS